MMAVLALACVAMAGGMVAMGLRLSGAIEREDKAIAAHLLAEKNSIHVSTELRRFQARMEGQRFVLLKDIERLEDDLQNCSTPGAVRSRLRSLAIKAKAHPHDPA